MASALLLVFAVFALAPMSSAYKILLFPHGNRSHLIEFHGLGLVLLNRGHQVYIYSSTVDTAPSEIANAGYKFIHPSLNETLMPMVFTDEEVIRQLDQSFVKTFFEVRESMKIFKGKLLHLARTIVNDQQTLEVIRKEKFDFAVVDSISAVSYVFLIPHKLGIPYAGLTTLHDPFHNRVAHFPSAFPDAFFSSTFGVEAHLLGSSFAMRFKNFIGMFFHEYYMQGWTAAVFEEEGTTYEEIMSKMEINLIDQHYMMSDPMPTTANVLMVGGLVTRAAQPIKAEKLLEFIEGSPHPVIVCSFGTMMQSLTPEVLRKLFDAFRSLPQYRIVMRLKNAQVQDVPANLLLLDWLPQNDLLAHSKTVLLITHSGNNGQLEALYHAVPMVAFYVFGDQKYNADRVERRGYGVKLNLMAFEVQGLVEAVNTVMSNDSYRLNIKRASEIFHQVPAGEVAADAIEHVIKFGGDHLRPHEALSLSMIEFTMLDLVFYFFLLLTALAYLLYKLIARAVSLIF